MSYVENDLPTKAAASLSWEYSGDKCLSPTLPPWGPGAVLAGFGGFSTSSWGSVTRPTPDNTSLHIKLSQGLKGILWFERKAAS